MSKWINDVGQILVSKKGNLYMQITQDIDLKEGDRLTMKSKKDEILESVKAGKISEERGEELLEKLSFIKYTLHKMPND